MYTVTSTCDSYKYLWTFHLVLCAEINTLKHYLKSFPVFFFFSVKFYMSVLSVYLSAECDIFSHPWMYFINASLNSSNYTDELLTFTPTPAQTTYKNTYKSRSVKETIKSVVYSKMILSKCIEH